MRGRIRVGCALAAIAVAVGGCATATTYQGPTIAITPQATDIARTPDCVKGDQTCIDAVVTEMQRRYEKLAAACDHRSAFALMYLRVTEGVKQPAAGRFNDQGYLRRLDAEFARLYFKAFDLYQAGKRPDPAWRIAFDSARKGQTTGIGDMLLGMNAHISNDLPFAAAALGLSKKRQVDFDEVNDLLGDVQRPMIEEEARRFDPSIATATLPYLGVHGGDIATVIAGWRTEAWQNAEKLEGARTRVERARVAAAIHRAAAERAQVIQALASNRLLGGDAKQRDSFCKSRDQGR